MNGDNTTNESRMEDQVQHSSRIVTLQSTSKKTRNLRYKRVHSSPIAVRRVFSLMKRRDSMNAQEFKQVINRIVHNKLNRSGDEWFSIGDLSRKNLNKLRELLDSIALSLQSSKKELLSRVRVLIVVLRKRVRAIL
jgi:hypothetical protein